MVRKIRAKVVLRLRAEGLSGRAIAASQGMSRHGVAAVLEAAERAGIDWDGVAERPTSRSTPCCSPGGASIRACSPNPTGRPCTAS